MLLPRTIINAEVVEFGWLNLARTEFALVHNSHMATPFATYTALAVDDSLLQARQMISRAPRTAFSVPCRTLQTHAADRGGGKSLEVGFVDHW